MQGDLRAARRVLTAFDTDGSAVVVSASRINMHVGQCVFLTKVAGRLWRQMLGTQCTVDEALAVVAQHYRVPLDVLTRDMLPVVETLYKNRILRKVK